MKPAAPRESSGYRGHYLPAVDLGQSEQTSTAVLHLSLAIYYQRRLQSAQSGL